MKIKKLRQLFLTYFKERGHIIVPSSSLVPNDSTLLFTNAGMVQFKETFLGIEDRSYCRATSSQRCVRAGGKHNDLENVGYTARHHTFFEMLGNFSFGDYFKREAIAYAWDFLTQVLKLPPERLWVTVYEQDPESEDIWLNEIKVSKDRFSRCGAKDNFWSMGDTGPCGPCTEIYYDHGPSVAGGPPGSVDEEGDRYIEIWNLVFMQYNRAEDGKLTPLPKPSVDTGMGLERIAAVMQGVHSNYDIDLFQQLIKAIAKLGDIHDLHNKSLRVIADHIRACVFLINDGVVPSNEGRGYVLRRICRRAIRHGFRVGFKEPFFYKLVKPLVHEMGEAYPELIQSEAHVERILQQEELQFARTLEQGLRILEQDIANLSDNMISGDTVFKLYDTYGFPVDLTSDIARERGLTIDMAGFNTFMAAQKERARSASQFSANFADRIDIDHKTDFTGYENLEEEAEIVGLYQDSIPVSELKEGEIGAVVLTHTPFYAESGGQVGDQGILRFQTALFEVQNTRKVQGAHLHYGVMQQGSIQVNQKIQAKVDNQKRKDTALNHSATHLLHAALRNVLGTHVQQKGSLVEPNRLRFDYAHFEPLKSTEIRAIEWLVNEKIRENSLVKVETLPVEQALKKGAMALFGEKYGDTVRVLNMAEGFSIELCGGTHINRTGDIGFFKIISESGISAGVRRIEAITGKRAMMWVEGVDAKLSHLTELLKCNRENIEERAEQLILKVRELEKEINQVKTKMNFSGGSITDQIREIKGLKVLAAKLPVGDVKSLRIMIDELKNKLGTAVILLAVTKEQKVNLVAGVTKDCITRISAGELVNYVAVQIGGKGGGRSDMAEAGGNNPDGLDEALNSVYGWVEERLK